MKVELNYFTKPDHVVIVKLTYLDAGMQEIKKLLK